MNEITTIISDLGGVYLNRGIWLFWDHIFENYKIPVETTKMAFLKDYKNYFSGKITEEQFWTALLREINLNENWTDLREKLLDFFRVNQDTSSYYKALRVKGFKIVLLSDQSKEWWPELDEKLDISSNFDHVVVSALVGLNKPNPEIYKYVLNVCGSKPDQCVFIDDIETNLPPAQELGMKTILYTNAAQTISDLQGIGVFI